MLEIIKKLVPQNWNDTLGLLLGVFTIPVLWLLQGLNVIELPESAMGASIVIETMVAQFYFRKAQGESES